MHQFLAQVSMADAASDVTATGSDVSIGQIAAAFSAHENLLGTGLAISAGLALVNRMGWLAKVPSKFLPWVSLALGVLTGVGHNLVQGQALTPAISQGVMAGVMASGMWELVLQYIPGLKAK